MTDPANNHSDRREQQEFGGDPIHRTSDSLNYRFDLTGITEADCMAAQECRRMLDEMEQGAKP